MRNSLQSVALAALLVACQPASESPGTADAAGRSELLAADRAFAALAVEAGIEAAYEAYLAPDAVQLPDGGQPRAGKPAIMRNVAEAAAANSFTLSWEPEDARVGSGGDLGYTWGRYYLEGEDDAGRLFDAEGKYANVWQRDAKGEWRVVLDISNQNEMLLGAEFELDGYLDETVAPGPGAE